MSRSAIKDGLLNLLGLFVNLRLILLNIQNLLNFIVRNIKGFLVIRKDITKERRKDLFEEQIDSNQSKNLQEHIGSSVLKVVQVVLLFV
jgi:hypothetical protein